MVVSLGALVVIASVLVVTLTSAPQNGLSSRLLNASELPLGWAKVSTTSASPVPSKSGCLSGLISNPSAGFTHRSVSFDERSDLPGLGEYLATGPAIASHFDASVRSLDACHSLTFKEGTTTFRATISPIAVASVGSGSAAFSLEFEVGRLPIVVDFVLFHTSKYVGEIIYSNSVPPTLTSVAALAKAAADKAEGKSVSVSTLSIISAPVRIAHTSEGDVGYREFGSGPPLVMIMGYGGTMEAWDPRFVDALALHYKVIIFDNAGIGDTGKLTTPLTIDAMAGQTSAFIDALGLKRPDVLGWSMGGMIAQALAVEHPSQVGRLVLCATFPGTGSIKPSQAAINDLKSANPAKVMSALFPSNQPAAKEGFEIATGDYPPSSSPSSAVISGQTVAVDEWFAGLDLAGQKTATISAPTLVADGAVDRLDPLPNDRRLAASIPGAQLVLYPDAGHAFLFQREETFVPVVVAFLGAA